MASDNRYTTLLDRITSDPQIMVGKPVIRGTRLTAEYILGLLTQGQTTAEIIEEYPGLTDDDIRACIFFASRSLSQTTFLPLTGESA